MSCGVENLKLIDCHFDPIKAGSIPFYSPASDEIATSTLPLASAMMRSVLES